jgi:hypothetical protein
MVNETELYNIQLKKVINKIPLNDIKLYLKKYNENKYGKTKLEGENMTYPYYYNNINTDIYKDILNICKKNNIYLHISFSPYKDKIFFLNNIVIIVLVNNSYDLKYKHMHLLDLYLRYTLPLFYNYRLLKSDLYNYINSDNNTTLLKLSKDKLKLIEDNRNNLTITNSVLNTLNSSNYVITGIDAYNNLLDDNIDEQYKTLLLFNTDIEFLKILKNEYHIEKKKCKIYIFTHYFDIYDNDILLMRIFDMRKTPISTYKNTNYTNPHGTIVFLFINYLLDNNLLDLYLAYNLIYELKKGTNNMINECFNNNIKINNLKYIINNKLK